MMHLDLIVIPRVAFQWRVVGDFLDYHPNMIKVYVIEQQYKGPIQCCQDLFRSWLGENFGV